MRIDTAGLPFIGGAIVLALMAGTAVSWVLALPFLVLGAFFLFFFRDPERQIAAGEHEVLAPADGRVLVAGDAVAAAQPEGAWKQISIFLSPMDVHVNRVPGSGRIKKVGFQRGKYLPADHHDAAAT